MAEGKSIYERSVKDEKVLAKMEEKLKEMLGWSPYAPRHRAWDVDAENNQIHIRGRYGGGNREDYEDQIDNMYYGPFIREYEGGDETMLTFVYELPKKEWEQFLKKWSKYISDSN